ncbi:GAL4 enhancer protein [Tilletia horrida]|uniref:Nascent polypeptide-associated complex subunit alpha n=1 Tax=Tilletia horrida TaxID=155126 RepID=A0AAN6G895_9BASI|nr:GAL4 enhancer protein [Tilletia horrida]KAK0526175.1 GAL4 enhancer protein [Tilletia horrida]KAK0526806.1 GAL4 enhancer protein [Tilletia horrida]
MASIEEVTDEVQDLNVADSSDENENGEVSVPDRIQSRAERKSRKALQNLGLKRVPGISRVTMRRPRGHLVVISNPEVYKSAYTDVYIVFGEAKNEENGLAAQQAALQQQQAQETQQRLVSEGFAQQMAALNAAAAAGSGKEKADGEGAAAEEEEDDSEPIDEEGVDAKDIELVMAQVGCSRRKAVKALKESKGELIDAIMNAS